MIMRILHQDRAAYREDESCQILPQSLHQSIPTTHPLHTETLLVNEPEWRSILKAPHSYNRHTFRRKPCPSRMALNSTLTTITKSSMGRLMHMDPTSRLCRTTFNLLAIARWQHPLVLSLVSKANHKWQHHGPPTPQTPSRPSPLQ